jgi:hypothetical protein
MGQVLDMEALAAQGLTSLPLGSGAKNDDVLE